MRVNAFVWCKSFYSPATYVSRSALIISSSFILVYSDWPSETESGTSKFRFLSVLLLYSIVLWISDAYMFACAWMISSIALFSWVSLHAFFCPLSQLSQEEEWLLLSWFLPCILFRDDYTYTSWAFIIPIITLQSLCGCASCQHLLLAVIFALWMIILGSILKWIFSLDWRTLLQSVCTLSLQLPHRRFSGSLRMKVLENLVLFLSHHAS